jgi:hypothetical protein
MNHWCLTSKNLFELSEGLRPHFSLLPKVSKAQNTLLGLVEFFVAFLFLWSELE